MGGNATQDPAQDLKSRRKWLRVTHLGFQSRFLLLCFGIGLLTTIISLTGLYAAIATLVNLATHLKVLDWGQIEGVLYNQIYIIWVIMLAILLVNLVVSVILGLYFSHRVSGLVFRLTNTLNDFADGKPVSQVAPRKGDFFVELAAAVNRITKKN